MRRRGQRRRATFLELLARTPSAIARAAQRTGNASGAHQKSPAKQARLRARQEEREARRGLVD